MTRWILHEWWIAALELALIALIAFSLAYWTWAVFGPRPLAAPAPSLLLEPERAASAGTRHLLGAADGGAGTAGAARAGGPLTLVGVFAERAADAGRALIAPHGGKPSLAAVGESIGDGVVLHEVHADHVVVLRNGAPERIDIERRAALVPPVPVPRPPVSPSVPVRK